MYHITELDLLPWLVTFFVSLGAGFEYGILLGVVASLLMLLYPWARPRIKVSVVTAEMFVADDGKCKFHVSFVTEKEAF